MIIDQALKTFKIRYIIFIYIFVNLVLGVIYFCLTFYIDSSHGLSTESGILSPDYLGLFDSIYFSFVSSSSLGYGDIIPHGISKLLSILSVFFGLSILSFFVAKMVSRKQEILLQHLYQVSFEEKIRSLRSGLYPLREGIDLLRNKMIDKRINKEELMIGLNLKLMSFSTHLTQLNKILKEKKIFQEFDDEKLVFHILLSLHSFNNLLILIKGRHFKINASEINDTSKLVLRSIEEITKLFKNNAIEESQTIKKTAKEFSKAEKRFRNLIKDIQTIN